MVFRALKRKCGLILAWRARTSAIAAARADSSRARTWADDLEDHGDARPVDQSGQGLHAERQRRAIQAEQGENPEARA